MNIGHRIKARKVVLSYCYQYCFFYKLEKKDNILKDVLFVDGIFESQKTFCDKKDLFVDELDKIWKSDYKLQLSYLIENFFDKWEESSIDMDYVFSVGKVISSSFDDVWLFVDKYTSTFSFDQMGAIEQTLFVLWYAEWKVLDTPKEILLNELIELAKRYADIGSSKLVNWIMHKILSEDS